MTETGRHWLVLRTHRARELWAAENVARQGHDWYFPKILKTVKRKNSGSLDAVSEPLFPGFLFVLPRSDGQWGHLLNTFGVKSVLMTGGFPSKMADRDVRRFRDLEDKDGFVVLPKNEDCVKEKFVIGQELKVVDGPFSGYHGICQGQDSRQRIKLLMDYMSRKTQVLIESESVKEIS